MKKILIIIAIWATGCTPQREFYSREFCVEIGDKTTPVLYAEHRLLRDRHGIMLITKFRDTILIPSEEVRFYRDSAVWTDSEKKTTYK